MGRPPIRPQKAPPKTGDPTVDRALLEQHRRLMELEDRSDLSGSVASSVVTLSGTVDAHFIDLSGSVDSAIKALTSGGLTAVSHDSSLSGDGTAANKLSALPTFSSLQAGVTASVGSAYSSLQVGVTASVDSVYSSLQVGTTASIGSLSGTVNARFLNLTGSLISSISEMNSSLIGLSGTMNADMVALWSNGGSPRPHDLSGSIDGAFKALSGTMASAFFDAEFSGSLAVNFYAFSGSIDQAIVVHGVDPKRSFQYYTDFIDLSAGSVGKAGTGADITLGWNQMHPGVLIETVQAVTSYGYWEPQYAGASTWNIYIPVGGGRVYMEALVKIPTLSNGTDNVRCVMGLGDSIAGSMTNACCFINDHGTYGDNTWRLFVSTTGGSAATYPVGGAWTAGAAKWTLLQIEISEDCDVVTGSMNGVSATVTTAAIGFPGSVQYNPIISAYKKTGSSNTMYFEADYFRFYQIFTGSRTWDP